MLLTGDFGSAKEGSIDSMAYGTLIGTPFVLLNLLFSFNY
jgi:hypothetical protein